VDGLTGSRILIAVLLLRLLPGDIAATPQEEPARTIAKLPESNVLHGTAAVGSGFVITFGTHAQRILGTVGERGDLRRMGIVAVEYAVGEDLVVGTDEDWWYSVAGQHRNAYGVTFIRPGAARALEPAFVPVQRRRSAIWIALRGADSRGVLLQTLGDDGRLLVQEISAAGILRSWTIPGISSGLTTLEWSAQPLRDGRIALLSVDSSSPAPVSLWLLDDNGELGEEHIDCEGRHRIVTTARAGDRVELSVESFLANRRRVVQAASFDTESNTSTPCHAIAEGTWPRITSSGDRILVAWADAPSQARHRLHACVLPCDDALPVGEIPRGEFEDWPYFVQPRGEDVTFTWSRGEEIKMRVLRAPFQDSPARQPAGSETRSTTTPPARPR
jgi:hypothetical protein